MEMTVLFVRVRRISFIPGVYPPRRVTVACREPSRAVVPISVLKSIEDTQNPQGGVLGAFECATKSPRGRNHKSALISPHPNE